MASCNSQGCSSEFSLTNVFDFKVIVSLSLSF